MRTSVLIASTFCAAMASVAGAQAQVYGGYAPPAPYAGAGYDYARGSYGGCGDGFTLAGARAGVTVLGLDIDAGAGLRVGTSAGCRPSQPPPPQPVYAPQYAPAPYPQPQYVEPQYVEPRYVEPQYAPQPYVEAPPAYGYAPPCGCEPMRYEAPSRYGW